MAGFITPPQSPILHRQAPGAPPRPTRPADYSPPGSPSSFPAASTNQRVAGVAAPILLIDSPTRPIR